MKFSIIVKRLFLAVPLVFATIAIAWSQTPFQISIVRDLQDPLSKEFDMIVVVNSEISTDRATLTVSLPEGLESTDKLARDINLRVGENKYFFNLKPNQLVNGDVSVTVQNFESDRSFLSTQRASINTNFDLEVKPLTNEFLSLKTLYFLRSTSLYIAIACFVGYLVLFVISKLLSVRNVNPFNSKEPNDSKILAAIQAQKSGTKESYVAKAQNYITDKEGVEE